MHTLILLASVSSISLLLTASLITIGFKKRNKRFILGGLFVTILTLAGVFSYGGIRLYRFMGMKIKSIALQNQLYWEEKKLNKEQMEKELQIKELEVLRESFIEITGYCSSFNIPPDSILENGRLLDDGFSINSYYVVSVSDPQSLLLKNQFRAGQCPYPSDTIPPFDDTSTWNRKQIEALPCYHGINDEEACTGMVWLDQRGKKLYIYLVQGWN